MIIYSDHCHGRKKMGGRWNKGKGEGGTEGGIEGGRE